MENVIISGVKPKLAIRDITNVTEYTAFSYS